MANENPDVRQAIEESVEEFVRGVHSHNSHNPDVTISKKVVEWLQGHGDVIASFTEQLVNNNLDWNKYRPMVCRAAFHGGSLAALHAYSNNRKLVNKCDVKDALVHTGTICKARFGGRWIFCPWLPNGNDRQDST